MRLWWGGVAAVSSATGLGDFRHPPIRWRTAKHPQRAAAVTMARMMKLFLMVFQQLRRIARVMVEIVQTAYQTK